VAVLSSVYRAEECVLEQKRLLGVVGKCRLAVSLNPSLTISRIFLVLIPVGQREACNHPYQLLGL
jgi:hypothetical protein